MPYENDLVILVPDKNAHFLFHGVLSKASGLGLRPTSVQLDTHPLRDSGCLDADEILQSQAHRYAHAMVVVADHSRSGRPDMPRAEMEAAIEDKLAQSGWDQRARAVVVDPGIGRWLLEHELGERWHAGVEELQRTVEAALRQRRLPQSPELYRELGAKMVDEGETDPAWQKIVTTLKAWFGATPPEHQEQAPHVARFEALSEQWLRDTRSASSFTAVVSHPAYQEIITMGHEVVPLILRDLEREPKHWGPALHAITGAQPVPREHAGRVKMIAEDWLQWARENGYAW